MNVETTERYIADADLQNILEPPSDGGYLCLDHISTYYIFTTGTYDSVRGITWLIQKRLDKLTEMEYETVYNTQTW